MASGKSSTYRLRLPGPTAVPECVRMAMTAPMVSHRGPEFKEILIEAATHAQPVFGTSNDVLFFASSGTGVMEASLANILGEGDKALVVSNGQFGERFMLIAESLGLQAEAIEAPWGETVSPEAVARRLKENDYQAVVAVHNESSTGAVADLEALGAVVAATPAVLVVDSVSGLGGIEMHQDDWGIDVVASASQKALMCPPGLGLVSVSDKAWKVIENGRRRSGFYWDFLKARDAAAKGQTAFTSPMPLILALREALRMIDEEGLPHVLARHRRLAAAMRAGGQALGFSIFTKAPLISDTVTVFMLPDGLDGAAVVRHMYERYGTVIGGSRTKLQGRVIRIGTMGSCNEEDIRTDLEHLERTLSDLGWPVERGTGVAAVNAALLEAA
ncbi:MAG TPA: alanine--glyoxylate aminotransferase family protein [Rhodospirillales bacterium]|jgi:aspartate aminotransferase-like enzyme|nr:alanine--glyoxylate aminotransferase family protein [Rhodospirillales bacterium]